MRSSQSFQSAGLYLQIPQFRLAHIVNRMIASRSFSGIMRHRPLCAHPMHNSRLSKGFYPRANTEE
jgi:hypothetical protein